MAQQVLTARDHEIIASHTKDGPEERYPEIPRYAFKGRHAFDLRRKIHLYFYSKEQMVPSGTSYSTAQGKQWLELLDAEPGNLL